MKKKNFGFISILRQIHSTLPSELDKITVCDREGDLYELFWDAQEMGETFLIRLTQNRFTQEGFHLFDSLKASPVKGSLLLQIGRKPKEHLPAHAVKMDYHYEKITIQNPNGKQKGI